MSGTSYASLCAKVGKDKPTDSHDELVSGSQAVFGVQHGGEVYAHAIQGTPVEQVTEKLGIRESEVNVVASHILQVIPN